MQDEVHQYLLLLSHAPSLVHFWHKDNDVVPVSYTHLNHIKKSPTRYIVLLIYAHNKNKACLLYTSRCV